MNNLIKNREEALAAHELARTRMAGRQKDTFMPFKKGQKVWLDSRNLKTSYHKKIGPKREMSVDEVRNAEQISQFIDEEVQRLEQRRAELANSC